MAKQHSGLSVTSLLAVAEGLVTVFGSSREACFYLALSVEGAVVANVASERSEPGHARLFELLGTVIYRRLRSRLALPERHEMQLAALCDHPARQRRRY